MTAGRLALTICRPSRSVTTSRVRIRLQYTGPVAGLFDLDLLDDVDPFEIDRQVARLFKHPHLGIEDIHAAWQADPLFDPRNRQHTG